MTDLPTAFECRAYLIAAGAKQSTITGYWRMPGNPGLVVWNGDGDSSSIRQLMAGLFGAEVKAGRMTWDEACARVRAERAA